MLAGDLATTPLPQVLRRLALGAATGGLHVSHPAGDSGSIYLRGGQVCAGLLPAQPPRLGPRLVTGGRVRAQALAQAEEACRADGQKRPLADVLVQLGHVDRSDVDAVLREQLLSAMDELLGRTADTWRFRVNERSEQMCRPQDVDVLLAEADERRLAWRRIEQVVAGPDAVPVLSAAGGAEEELAVSSDAWALLCQVDGIRTVAQLATDCGFTLFEIGTVLLRLLNAGLLDMTPLPSAPASTGGSVASRLLAAFPTDGADRAGAGGALLTGMSDALAALLHPVTDESLFTARPRMLPPAASAPSAPPEAPEPPAPPLEAPGVVEAPPLLDDADRPEEPGFEQSPSDQDVVQHEPSAIPTRDGLEAGPDEWTLAREAFAELSAAARSLPADAVPTADVDDPARPPVEDFGQPGAADWADSDMPSTAAALGEDYPQREYANDTDTAALLRELSSLGLDDGPAAGAPVRPAAPRHSIDPLAGKRKKGLFGR